MEDKAAAEKLMKQVSFIGFEENLGQVADLEGMAVKEVLFKTNASGIDMYVTEQGISYAFFKTEEEEEDDDEPKTQLQLLKKKKAQKMEWCRIDMNLEGALIKKENIIKERLIDQGYRNFYLSHCPDGIVNVKSYGKITIPSVYPNIDWVLYTDGNKGIKYDFVVHPGGNPKDIRLKYKGAGSIKSIAGNKIKISTKLGVIEEGSLVSYEKESGKTIASSYHIKTGASRNAPDTAEISFDLGDYDHTQPLIIDPPLVWATYYGAGNADGPNDITVDNAGNVYITGYTNSTNFPCLAHIAPATGTSYFDNTFGGTSAVTDLF